MSDSCVVPSYVLGLILLRARTQVGLGASGSQWPVISEENRPIAVPTDLLKCDMKACLSVVPEACIY